MKYNPHDYQSYAAGYIESNPISAILLSMGLGKTSITLTAVNNLLFDSFDVHKVLIIGPLRVARTTWPDEIRKWDHLSDLQYSVVVGTVSERKAALGKQADIYIINRENVQWLIEESGYPFDFDMVVVDELSSFKNHQAKRFKALMKVRPRVKRIVGLTGTPSSNGLMDLFAEFKLLDMGERLGRFIGQYRNAYLPRTNAMDRLFSPTSHCPEPRMPFTIKSRHQISMKSTDHLKMPELISSQYMVHLSKEERNRYEELKRDLVLSLPDGEVTASNAASLTGKLSQMANGAVYSDDESIIKIHDQKLDALEDIIEAANGKPLLVAYWFRHDLERITERLHDRHIPFARLDTDNSIRRWNNGDYPVALIHPASAGHGLNLQSGGSTIVWFGLTWSLELYQQTNARLWRQGQSSETVVIQHIIAENTIDERILKALSEKDSTQQSLIDAVKANL